MTPRALIVGAGETAYVRRARDETTMSLLADATLRALTDAQLSPADVDGLAVASLTLAPDHAIDVAWRLGLRLRWVMEDTNGGASGLNMLQHARRAIEAGDARVVVLVAGDVFNPGDFAALVSAYNSATRDHLSPLGVGGPNSLFALVARRHMRAHALDREDYGKVAIAQREWASRNPGAVYREELTMAEYLEAPLVADPLCRYDCAPVVSGADAVVVAATGRAGEKPAVAIRALEASYNHDHQEGDGLRTGLAEIAPRLWAAAEVKPHAIDLLSIYDDYPVMVLVQLADLGFIADGDVRRFIDQQLASRALPVNTSGGQLSAGQAGAAGGMHGLVEAGAAGGMHGLVEAVRQLRGDAGERQLERARTALVSGYGTVLYRYGGCSNAVVLERLS